MGLYYKLFAQGFYLSLNACVEYLLVYFYGEPAYELGLDLHLEDDFAAKTAAQQLSELRLKPWRRDCGSDTRQLHTPGVETEIHIDVEHHTKGGAMSSLFYEGHEVYQLFAHIARADIVLWVLEYLAYLLKHLLAAAVFFREEEKRLRISF